MKKTIKLKRISVDRFESYFVLDSPGYFIARDAVKAGEIGNVVDALEALCLANELYENVLLEHMLRALKPLGKGEEYLRRRGTPDVGDFVIEALGKERATEILRDVMAEVRQLAKIGTGENDKAPRRAPVPSEPAP